MRFLRIALIVSVIFSGLFAGLMFTFSVVIERMLVSLSASEYTRVMQGLIRGADDPPVAAFVVITTLLAPLVVLWQARHNHRDSVFRLTLIGWIVFALGVFVVTVGFNAPINYEIRQWSSQSPPADWMQTRDRWNRLNLIRTPVTILVFICFTLALSRERGKHAD